MIRCIAIDDEPLALDVIEKFVNRIPEFKLVGRFTSALEVIEILKKEKVDLLLLDIQMPEISGIQFLRTLKDPPMVVFTTAYENFAVESYNLDVVDYLLKPIAFERFQKAAKKVKEIQNLRHPIKEKDIDYIFVRSEYQMIKIKFDEIVYIEGLKDYVKIFCGPKPVFSHQNLKSIESKLPADQFIRIHKSYIVSIKKIEAVHKNMARIGVNEIPIGDMYREQINKILKR